MPWFSSPVCPDVSGDLKELRMVVPESGFLYMPGKKGMAEPHMGRNLVWFRVSAESTEGLRVKRGLLCEI